RGHDAPNSCSGENTCASSTVVESVSVKGSGSGSRCSCRCAWCSCSGKGAHDSATSVISLNSRRRLAAAAAQQPCSAAAAEKKNSVELETIRKSTNASKLYRNMKIALPHLPMIRIEDSWQRESKQEDDLLGVAPRRLRLPCSIYTGCVRRTASARLHP
ncbi:unnamed protein product, partial [Heterotrigona itama]